VKILHVIHSLDPRGGGPSQVIRGMVRAQVTAGHEVALVATSVQAAEPWEADSTFRHAVQAEPALAGCELAMVAAFGRRRPWSTYAYSPEGRRWVRTRLADPDRAPQVVHVHGVFSHLPASAAAEARRRGIPYVLRPAGILDSACLRTGRQWLKRAFMRLSLHKDLSRAAWVQATSEHEAAELRRWVPHGRVRIVPNGTDLPALDRAQAAADFLARFPQLAGKRVVLFLGRIAAKKRPEMVLEALAQLRPEFPDAVCLVAGPDDGHLQALLAAADKHAMRDALVLTGFLQGRAKQGAFALADLFVLPSVDENSAVAVLEAMAHGVPVLVTPGVASHVYVDECGAGLTVPGSAREVAEGLRRLLRSGRDEWGRRGRAFVAENLSWSVVARELDRLYQEMVFPAAGVLAAR